MHILPLPAPHQTIHRHFSPGDVSTPPSPLSRSQCAPALANALHRANLLECRVIPDKMTIFLECRHLASPGHPGEHLKIKKPSFCRVTTFDEYLRTSLSLSLSFSLCKSTTNARLAAVSRLL